MLKYRFLIAVLAMAIPLRATTMYYAGNEASFNTAVLGLTQMNSTTTFSPNGFSGTTFSNAGGTGINFLGLDGSSNPISLSVSSNTLQQTVVSDPIEATMPGASNILALGLHFNYTGTSGFVNWCFGSTNGGCDYGLVTTVGASDIEFFGIVSTTSPLTAPIFVSRSNFIGPATLVIDNFKAFDSVSQTPEPTTMALMGFGLVILSAIRRRRAPKVPRPQPVAVPFE